MKKTLLIAIFSITSFVAPISALALTWTPTPIPDANTPVTYSLADDPTHVHWFTLVGKSTADWYPPAGNCIAVIAYSYLDTLGIGAIPLSLDFDLGSLPDEYYAVEMNGTSSSMALCDGGSPTGIPFSQLSSESGVIHVYTLIGAAGNWFLPSDILSNLASPVGAAISTTTGGLWPIILIFMGVPFAFYVIKKILDMLKMEHDKDARINALADATMRETEKLLRNRRET